MTMDPLIIILNSTIKMLHKPNKSSILKAHLVSTYSTKSMPDSKNDCLVQPLSESALRPNALRSAKQFLKELIPRQPTPKKGFTNNFRINELNIQMISKSLYEQIFGLSKPERNVNCPETIQKYKEELQKHGLWTEEANSIPDVCLNLPKLKGKNIEEHFWQIGMEQSEPYKKLMCSFINNGIPEKPELWMYQKGWTKYKKGEDPSSVLFPKEDALVFDVEVCVRAGQTPVLAVAVSADAWYGWVSPSLVEKNNPISPKHYSTDMLIPLEEEKEKTEKPRIIIGHSVSYDRARIKEQYYLENSALRFMDTMALHICIGGASSIQKSQLKSEGDEEILKTTCLTSLQDVYSLYCNGNLSKDERQVFTEGMLEDVRKDFQNLMDYCASDVKATYEVFQILFPLYLERFPHPVTLAGMLEIGMSYLPVNNNWEKYLKDTTEKFDDLEMEMSFLLAKKCNDACRLMHNEEYKNDLWLWNEDWSTQELRLTKKPVKENPIVAEMLKEDDEETKKLVKKFKYLFDLESVLPQGRPLLPGYPAWYRKLCRKPDSMDWTPGPHSLHTTLTIAPKVLNLTYENYPLHYIRELGWGILVANLNAKPTKTSLPYDRLKKVTLKNMLSTNNGSDSNKSLESTNLRVLKKEYKNCLNYSGTAIWCGRNVNGCAYFLKLPHKDGCHKNVGQPLSKSFSSVLSFNRLAGPDYISKKGLEVNNMLSYWRNNKDRIMDQMVVWLKPDELGPYVKKGSVVGIILPKIVVCGTLTRRAVEPTWLTAPRSPKSLVGSELRAMVQAPPGYHFIGADVDSQELWIASVIGDSRSSGVHGGTPFGWMTISGTKLKGTDLHSVTAKAAGISRDQAKLINYARIYGAGIKFAEKLLQQCNPTMPEKVVREKARKMYSLTKGVRHFKLKENYLRKLRVRPKENICFNSVFAATNFAKKWNSTVDIMFEDQKWQGGTESAVFNELEKIASSLKPETPFLGSRLSRALEPRFTGDDLHLSTRINWVVQSGAVDFLHLMLTCMRWLTNGRVRYCLSVHDELRYLAPSEYRYEAALALQITNLLTRSFFAHRMGLYDLPFSVAFFSSVEIDTVMRKDVDDDCITHSNPHGLEKGYGIPKGESLTIYDTISKTGTKFSAFGKEP